MMMRVDMAWNDAFASTGDPVADKLGIPNSSTSVIVELVLL